MANQKTRKVLDIQCEGKHIVCIWHNEAKYNPYKLYEKKREYNKYGVPTERRKLLSEFEIFESVLLYIGHTWHKM